MYCTVSSFVVTFAWGAAVGGAASAVTAYLLLRKKP